jgi:ABC-2 type transport system permease protein
MSSLAAPRFASVPRMLGQQLKLEYLRLLRVPAFSLISLALPIILFTFFGLKHVNDNNCAAVNCGQYLLVSFGAYGFTSMMVFSFGIGVAIERGQRTNVLFRATPLPGVVLMLAKVIAAFLYGIVVLGALVLYAMVVGGVRIDPVTLSNVVMRLMVGSLPFIGLGFAIGYVSGPNSAPALANLIYLPMSFASGLFVPLSQLPDFVQRISPYLPANRYAQLAWAAIGVKSVDPDWVNLLWLIGYTVVLLGIAVWAYQREEKSKFG